MRIQSCFRRAVIVTCTALVFIATCAATSIQGSEVREFSYQSNVDSPNHKHMGKPVFFSENRGQWDSRVLFRAGTENAIVWFTQDAVVYQFTRQDYSKGFLRSMDRGDYLPEVEQLTIQATFEGSATKLDIAGDGLLQHRSNYFIGNDPDKWYTDIPNYKAILIKNVYDGIDIRYYGESDFMEYDFVLQPGADLTQIEVRYEGADLMQVDERGRLVVAADWATVFESTPHIYQDCDDSRVELSGRYIAHSANSFGFEIDGDYDDAFAVVIDPVLAYGTYLGAGQSDQGIELALDGMGNIIMAGITYSSDFPVQNEYQTDQPNADFFVAKFSSSGDALLYSTYLGGDDYDGLSGLDADAAGNAYVTGAVSSTDYPTVSAYMTDQPSDDAVVTKLNPAGNGLVFSTYLGGIGADYSGGISVGPGNNVFVTGRTNSSNFPILNSYDPGPSGYDVFVTKFNSSGSGLLYSSIVSGTYYRDIPYDIVVDVLGCAYIAGETESSDYATVNAYQTDQPGWDGFVTKFTAAGSDLLYSTYLGGSDYDCMQGIALADNGEVVVTGYSYSSDFPEVNAYQSDQPGQDAVVARFDASGQPVFCTYLGGDGDDDSRAVAVDQLGDAYVTGWTLSSDFPLVNPIDTSNNNVDIFVTGINASGSSLIFSTYVAGDYGTGHGFDIKRDQEGRTIVSGYSWDLNIDLPGALDPTPNGQADAILLIFEDDAYLCGDADASGGVDIDDVVYLIAYIFGGGPAPVPLESGDADCSGGVDIDDAVHLISYIFGGGNSPCDTNGDGVPDC